MPNCEKSANAKIGTKIQPKKDGAGNCLLSQFEALLQPESAVNIEKGLEVIELMCYIYFTSSAALSASAGNLSSSATNETSSQDKKAEEQQQNPTKVLKKEFDAEDHNNIVIFTHETLTRLKAVNKKAEESGLLKLKSNENVFYLLELSCLHRVFRKWRKDPVRLARFADTVRSSGHKACLAYTTAVTSAGASANAMAKEKAEETLAAFSELVAALSSATLDVELCMRLTEAAALTIPPTLKSAQSYIAVHQRLTQNPSPPTTTAPAAPAPPQPQQEDTSEAAAAESSKAKKRRLEKNFFRIPTD